MSRKNALKELNEYLTSLKLHREGRMAVHLKVSLLERHLRQPSFRMAAAAHLKPLIDKYSAKTFNMKNGDIIVLMLGATIKNIDNALWNVRDEYKESVYLQSLTFTQGENNAFINWYDLETQFDELRENVSKLDSKKPEGKPSDAKSSAQRSKISSDTSKILGDRSYVRPSKKVRILPIDPPSRGEMVKDLDPELFVSLTKALYGADVSGMLRKQTVAVRTPDSNQVPVMVHHFIPMEVVFAGLLRGVRLIPNMWLVGYLEDFLTDRIMASKPSMYNDGSLASSMAVTVDAVLNKMFEPFYRALGDMPRSTLVLQFDIRDAISNPGRYIKAVTMARDKGFKTSIAGIDVVSLNWLSKADLTADFIKIRFPEGAIASWLTSDVEASIKKSLNHHGAARIILDACDDEDTVKLGQRLGINLFQGSVISPVSS